MSFKDLKEKFMGLLFTDEFVEDATFVKRESVEEVKKTVENIVREEIKEKPVEVKKEPKAEVKILIDPPKPKKKKKTEPVIITEPYEQRDIISPIYGNLNKPMPKTPKTTTKSTQKANKVLSPMYGVQSTKVEDKKPEELPKDTPVLASKKVISKTETIDAKAEDKKIEQEIKAKIIKIEEMISEEDTSEQTMEVKDLKEVVKLKEEKPKKITAKKSTTKKTTTKRKKKEEVVVAKNEATKTEEVKDGNL